MAKFNLGIRDVVPSSANRTSTFSAGANLRAGMKLKIAKDPQKEILTALENTRILFESSVVTKLIAALDAAMSSNIWNKIGETGDIIDSGALKRSLEVTVKQGLITINYNQDYAALVHYGGYIAPYGNSNIEKVYLPPRPWVQSVLFGGGPVTVFNFSEVYKEALNKFL